MYLFFPTIDSKVAALQACPSIIVCIGTFEVKIVSIIQNAAETSPP